MFSSFQILRNRRFLLEDLKSVVVSNLPKECFFWHRTRLFMRILNGKWESLRLDEVLLLLLPVAIVSPYAAWNAWHASEPLIPLEFKSVQVWAKSPCVFVSVFFLRLFMHLFYLKFHRVILCLKHIVSRVT